MPVSPAKFVIVTGLSGAGKSLVLRAFEDLKFFCIDNLPPALLPKLAELSLASEGRIRRVAIGLDIRAGFGFDEMLGLLLDLKKQSIDFEILFLDASDESIVKRFSETRRMHPLGESLALDDAIREERRVLATIKEKSHVIINTTRLNPWQLRDRVFAMYREGDPAGALVVTVVSFGFKNGLPMDADLVFDVRFLPNPHYDDALRAHDGRDRPVVDYIFGHEVAVRFRRKLVDFVRFLVPEYRREGKSHLAIAIGCTGGRHRSVAFAELLAAAVGRLGCKVILKHRDL